ncbi:MAG: hypothetical protein Ct9H300mP1_08220 [Planctomycetaceae bacterium]|nr:MAG: hypothetical protein Ct9H300mP1_08220 [Planctomycetaceae bacterium]
MIVGMIAPKRREKPRPLGDPYHDLFEKRGGAFPRAVPGHKAAKILEIAGHVAGIEGDRRPEVAEEIDQPNVADVVDKTPPPEPKASASVPQGPKS